MGEVSDLGQKIAMDRLDQVLWKLQRHAFHHAVIGVVAYLEGGVEAEQLREWHHRLVTDCPRLACRVGGSDRNPVWEHDPHFAVERQMSRISLPPDADSSQLLRLVHHLLYAPFALETPPWHGYLIEDAGGRTVYFLKISHALADGLRVVDLLRRRRPPVDGECMAPAKRDLSARAHGLRRAPMWYRLVADLSAAGRHRQLPNISAAREFEFFTVPLIKIKQAAKAAGQVSVNDVFLCGVARGLARYREEYEEETPRQLTVMSLVGRFRIPTRHTGNAINFASVRLPTPHADVKTALQETRKAIVSAGGTRPVDVAGLAAALSPHVPSGLIARGLKYAARRHDVMVTNVPAGQAPFSIADSRVTTVFGIPPLMGTGMITAMVTYQGTCHFTVHMDPAAISHPQGLCQCIRAALDDVVDIAQPHQ
ncbi:wax ester/triacylglycerol synthase domain-containing protein [Streptomyces sp. ISL-11]|uniref:wax ester/triacylglycerol synthase domain-containing protein n=1 Tax=Streptomyces sp. ISL-11 TaxID=2819174 RepID=UPI001BE8D4B5|nr:wax ester/triacylglycerol synthase domain-containing protein [Streptomyces sp. ISL-11]MBT2384969.1 DUF1298 domain-containing protein [Streptomyces sp. ISL-11]